MNPLRPMQNTVMHLCLEKSRYCVRTGVVILAMTFTLLSLWPQICERYPRDLPAIISKIQKMTCKNNSYAGTPSYSIHYKTSDKVMVSAFCFVCKLKIIIIVGAEHSISLPCLNLLGCFHRHQDIGKEGHWEHVPSSHPPPPPPPPPPNFFSCMVCPHCT